MDNNKGIKNIQKREFLRVTYPSIISIILEDGECLDYPIRDLSGGGVSFVSVKEKYKVGNLLKARMTVNQNLIFCYVKIVRIDEDRVSASIVQINENDRSKIIQECNRQQLKYRK